MVDLCRDTGTYSGGYQPRPMPYAMGRLDGW